MAYTGDGGEKVQAPPCERRPFGLMSVAREVPRGDPGWARGLEFDELACSGRPSVVSQPCPPPVEQLLTARRGYNTEFVDAFVIYDGWECSAIDGFQDAWDNAEALLDLGWETALERAFWTGVDQDGNAVRQSLAGGGATDVTPGSGAVDPVDGVSLLETFMAENSRCRPTFHAELGLGPYLAQRGQLLGAGPDGPHYLRTGAKLALGAGYPGTGPGGSAPGAGETWMFATGGVEVTHGPTFFTPERGDVAGAVRISSNDVRVFAQRMFAVSRACGIAAVRVTMESCC